VAVAIEFGSQASGTSTSSVLTLSSMDFNAEASDRIIAVDLTVEAFITISSITIGGEAADLLKAEAGGSRQTYYYSASVPTGTSGDVVVTLASGDAAMSVSTHSVTGADPTPTDTDSVRSNSAADLSLASLTIPTDGAGLASFCNGTDSTAVSWTGATVSHDTDAGAFRHSAAIVTDVGTNTITADGATANCSLIGVAWGPASGGAATSLVPPALLVPHHVLAPPVQGFGSYLHDRDRKSVV
jgi:hypothetical protein